MNGSGLSNPLFRLPQVYVGQSVRSPKHQFSEHQCALWNGDVAAFEHTWFTGHYVNLSKAKIIDTQPL